MKDMGKMMKQAQQLQAKMLKLQEEMASKTVESTAGGGMVKVVANGKQQLVSIQIEKEVIDPDDVEMLQDLVLAAANDALDEQTHRRAEYTRFNVSTQILYPNFDRSL